MALIFAFAALNVYAGINSGDEPYEFEEGLSDGGTYYYRTKDLEFKASNTEEIVLGGLQLLYKKGIYPVISIRIAGFEQSLIDLGKKTRRYEDKAMFNQTLTLTLTNGEVISTYEAGVSDVLKKEFEDAEMANLGIQASVSDLSSSRSDFSSMSSSNRISHYNPQIQISVVSGTKRSIFRQKNKTKRSKKRLHTTLIKPEQKVNEDLCSGFIVS